MKFIFIAILFPLLLSSCLQKGKSRLAPNLSVATRDTTEEEEGGHITSCHIRVRIGGKELPCGFEGRPEGGYVITPEGSGPSYYEIKVFLDISPEDSITTTLLDWGDGHRDVFKTYFFRKPGVIIRQKVWLNDSLVLDIPKRYGPKDLIFTIRR